MAQRPQTITEKILAAHAGLPSVDPGQLIEARLDFILANDITAEMAINVFRQAGGERVFDPERVALIPDHFIPNKDIPSAMQAKVMRDFARAQNLPHYYEVGRTGIEHAFLPEQGLVGPGDAVIGADSHTCTYGGLGAFATGVGGTDLGAALLTGQTWFRVPATMKFNYHGVRRPWVGGKDLILYAIGQIGVEGARYRAMEFGGLVIESLPMSDRLTLCNMAIEAGAKNGLVPPDAITAAYVQGRARRPYQFYASDAGCAYETAFDWDVSALEPVVALPHLPENVKMVTELPVIEIDQAIIGSCTNGRLEDLRQAAQVLKGRKAAGHVRLIIIPATAQIYQAALREGLFDIFLAAEAVISPPTCGPCLGGYMGILAAGERAVSTTNRNFVGRMGHVKSEVYLANPAVAAASAVLGRIAHPDEVVKA